MAGSIPYTGVNHVALVCRDMAETVEFYENVLGMPLVRSIGLGNHGQHFFFDCGGGATVAFFWFPDAPPAAPGIASQHLDVRKDGAASAIASMNHLAFNVDDDQFDAAVARLKAKGLKLFVINHSDGADPAPAKPNAQTWIRSVYFRDPNGIALEIAALTRPFRESDILVDPVNAQGQPVPRKVLNPA
ncbi:MAG TPA: VOC family protein [Rhizomicrobium sp.]|jgi:catechol 2,3-dioxygenase-like lactoylglutathione lyase family enzyme